MAALRGKSIFEWDGLRAAKAEFLPLGARGRAPLPFTERLSAARLSRLLRQTLEQASADDLVLFVYDLTCLEGRLRELWRVFPEVEHHAAIKAVALPPLLAFCGACGFGVEAASAGEIRLAVEAGIEPHKIVFDSPAKTQAELAAAVAGGLRIHADSLAEVERLAPLLAPTPGSRRHGLRINPQVGAGGIAATSVATAQSKFGEPLENREAIVAAFRRHPWLAGLHVHVGSQGCPLPLLAEGIGRVVDFALELEARIGRPLEFFNFGGGMPIRYRGGAAHAKPSLDDLRQALEARSPALFDCRWRLLSEFGRFLFGPAGFAAARVEAVKSAGGENIAICHAGADLFLRTAYQPQHWWHDLSVAGPGGALKKGRRQAWTVAGPLCFSGDLLATRRPLPPIEPGDWILVHDAGAYTLSMQSRYNSRVLPAVYGVQGRLVAALKEREDLDEMALAWV